MKKDKVIGIVGGMGPEAGLGLFQQILIHTSAKTDQDHLPVILMSFPGDLPDRTAFLEGYPCANPAYKVAQIIGQLEQAGAAVVAIACNTCHTPAIYQVIESELQRIRSRVKLLNIVTEFCRYIRLQHPDIRRIGVMTTNGTYRSGLYSNPLVSLGYEVVLPDPTFQNNTIHRMIYDPVFGIKANPHRISPEVSIFLNRAFHYFRKHRAEAVVLGCTELSLVVHGDRTDGLFIMDPTETMAMALIREATVGATLAASPAEDKAS